MRLSYSYRILKLRTETRTHHGTGILLIHGDAAPKDYPGHLSLFDVNANCFSLTILSIYDSISYMLDPHWIQAGIFFYFSVSYIAIPTC